MDQEKTEASDEGYKAEYVAPNGVQMRLRQEQVEDKIWYRAQFGRKADNAVSLGIWSTLDGASDDQSPV